MGGHPLLPHVQIIRHSGNDNLLTAVELSILSHTLGWPLHLHAEGMRGTGKTTVLRSAAAQLPLIRRIKGCLYNCIPEAPHCPQHRDLDPEHLARLGSEWVPMPFLEISHSAKLGTVVGTIDLKKVLDADRPEAALLPGTIAKANRGVVFIDEINRLADTSPELVDVLLDVMGTKPGRLQIEESGLAPVELPCQVAVWAASNPDEEPGPLEDIRRQLSDRFDVSIRVTGPETVEQVRAVLDRTAQGIPMQATVMLPGRSRFNPPKSDFPVVPIELRERLAALYVRFGLESLRAMEAWQWTARLYAWRREEKQVSLSDLVAVAPLILQHRVDPGMLAQLVRALQTGDAEATAEMAGASTAPSQEDGDGSKASLYHHGHWPAGSSQAQAGPHQAGNDTLDTSGRSLLNRVRGWFRGQDTHAAPSGATNSSQSGANGVSTPAEIPSPPNRARLFRQLNDEEIWQRLDISDRIPTP